MNTLYSLIINTLTKGILFQLASSHISSHRMEPSLFCSDQPSLGAHLVARINHLLQQGSHNKRHKCRLRHPDHNKLNEHRDSHPSLVPIPSHRWQTHRFLGHRRHRESPLQTARTAHANQPQRRQF